MRWEPTERDLVERDPGIIALKRALLQERVRLANRYPPKDWTMCHRCGVWLLKTGDVHACFPPDWNPGMEPSAPEGERP